MGLDLVALDLLSWNRERHGPLGRTVTLGRQGLHVPEATVRERLGLTGSYRHEEYCDSLLGIAFGASSVDSLDHSDYEGATIVHDLNLPIPAVHREQYDAVLDFGTLEHVFDIAQGLRTCSALLRPGGQIIHVLPANNLCGHGFWQFSPEVFLSLYTEANGYRDTAVFSGLVYHPWTLTPVTFGPEGERVLVQTTVPTYMVARTTVGERGFRVESVQQSDYRYLWEQSARRGG
jgi:SAM-dependent methyltransferase